jgi:hypothetical protein
MTVDVSRSCLSLATWVGSATRQIVVARALLTATAPPAVPASSVSDASLTPPLDVITGLLDQPAAGGMRRAMAQMKPVGSRAIAAMTTLAGLPVRASLR